MVKNILEYLNEQWSGATRAYKAHHRRTNTLSAKAHIASKAGKHGEAVDLQKQVIASMDKSFAARRAIPKKPDRQAARINRLKANPERNANKLHKRINREIRRLTGD